MGTVIFFIVLLALAGSGAAFYFTHKPLVSFYIEGLNQGFTFGDLWALWGAAEECGIEEPISLFISLASLSRCIAQIKDKSELEGAGKLQNLLTHLYDFRTKIEKDADKSKGLDSTTSLAIGQKLQVIFPGRGVYSSVIINNTNNMLIALPTKDGNIVINSADWVGQTVNVYLWRTGDAQYVFDTTVLSTAMSVGKPCLYLEHTNKLFRTQKRNAVRAKCHINAQLYILNEDDVDYNKVEARQGFRCILEDISATGALVKIGGEGKEGIKLRIQFDINEKLIVMFGVVRSVQYDNGINMSKLHFQCIHIDEAMKNEVLSYVYNILPINEKERVTAMNELNAQEEAEASSQSANAVENASGEGENSSNSGENSLNLESGDNINLDKILGDIDGDKLPEIEGF